MSDPLETSYDEVPYVSNPNYGAHIDCLATLGTLLGVPVASLDRCRVLEIGCAGGGNLIPQAMQFPNSQFLGIDLSTRQIAEGHEVIRAVGLANIELKALSLTDLNASFGSFDFILCHGVFSWVPFEVQDKILAICRDRLSPGGLAYISYNTYPGWHISKILRDLMNYHGQRFPDPKTRTQQARLILKFLAEAQLDGELPWSKLLKDRVNDLLKEQDYYLFHEYLEKDNHPCYFWEFMARAQGFGMQYVGNAYYHHTPERFPPDTQQTIVDLSEDLIQVEQFYDFLNNRRFRRTVLCRADVALDRAPNPEVMYGLKVSALASPLARQPDLFTDQVETFQLRRGEKASTNNPFVKVCLVTLAEAFPRALTFEALWHGVVRRFESQGPLPEALAANGRPMLAATLMHAYLGNFVSLHVRPFEFDLRPGDMPRASPLARFQASHGNSRVTNLRHSVTELNDFERVLVTLLDGTRDRGALVTALAEATLEGRLKVSCDGVTLEDRDKIQTVLAEAIEPALVRLAAEKWLIPNRAI